jgi:DNA Polymerase alpha zinc finger
METRQLSVNGRSCLRYGCSGTMQASSSERRINAHLLYLDHLFDEDHKIEQLLGTFGTREDIKKKLQVDDWKTLSALQKVCGNALKSSAYNWISPSCWSDLFPPLNHKTKYT